MRVADVTSIIKARSKKAAAASSLLPPGSVDSGPSYWPPRVPRTSGSPIQSQATPPTPNQCPPKIQPKQPIGGRGALASLKPQNSLPAMDPARWQDHISDGNSIYAIIISSVPASAPDSAHGRRNLGGGRSSPAPVLEGGHGAGPAEVPIVRWWDRYACPYVGTVRGYKPPTTLVTNYRGDGPAGQQQH